MRYLSNMYKSKAYVNVYVSQPNKQYIRLNRDSDKCLLTGNFHTLFTACH